MCGPPTVLTKDEEQKLYVINMCDMAGRDMVLQLSMLGLKHTKSLRIDRLHSFVSRAKETGFSKVHKSWCSITSGLVWDRHQGSSRQSECLSHWKRVHQLEQCLQHWLDKTSYSGYSIRSKKKASSLDIWWPGPMHLSIYIFRSKHFYFKMLECPRYSLLTCPNTTRAKTGKKHTK